MADVRLLCVNAMLYNGEHSDIYRQAGSMRERLWGQLAGMDHELTQLELALGTHEAGDASIDEHRHDCTRVAALSGLLAAPMVPLPL
jgi:hypothetical protein